MIVFVTTKPGFGVGLGDVGFVPVADVDSDGGEDGGLEGVGSGDESDGVVVGGEGDPADPVQFSEGSGCGESLVGEVGVGDAGLAEVPADESFDDSGEDTDADVAPDPVLGPVVDGSEMEEVFEDPESVFDVDELTVTNHDLSGVGLGGGEAGGEHVTAGQQFFFVGEGGVVVVVEKLALSDFDVEEAGDAGISEDAKPPGHSIATPKMASKSVKVGSGR